MIYLIMPTATDGSVYWSKVVEIGLCAKRPNVVYIFFYFFCRLAISCLKRNNIF